VQKIISTLEPAEVYIQERKWRRPTWKISRRGGMTSFDEKEEKRTLYLEKIMKQKFNKSLKLKRGRKTGSGDFGRQ